MKTRHRRSKTKLGQHKINRVENLTGDAGQDNLYVGLVTGVQGLKGEVRIRTFTHTPTGIGAFKKLVDAKGDPVNLRVSRLQKGFVVAQISGVSSRTEAENWIGKALFVPRSTLPVLDDEEYYNADLIGLQVESPVGKHLGNVAAVHDFGGGGIIEIEGVDGALVLLPFNADFVPEVDITNGRLIVIPQALELNDD